MFARFTSRNERSSTRSRVVAAFAATRSCRCRAFVARRVFALDALDFHVFQILRKNTAGARCGKCRIDQSAFFRHLQNRVGDVGRILIFVATLAAVAAADAFGFHIRRALVQQRDFDFVMHETFVPIFHAIGDFDNRRQSENRVELFRARFEQRRLGVGARNHAEIFAFGHVLAHELAQHFDAMSRFFQTDGKVRENIGRGGVAFVVFGVCSL